MFANIVERFHPEAFYGNPSRRQIFMVVDLDTPAKMAERMDVLTWFGGTEPMFTPVMRPEVYAEAIANAKRIMSPPVEATVLPETRMPPRPRCTQVGASPHVLWRGSDHATSLKKIRKRSRA